MVLCDSARKLTSVGVAVLSQDPIAFSRNHPREYEELVGGWRKFHGDELVSAYGGAV